MLKRLSVNEIAILERDEDLPCEVAKGAVSGLVSDRSERSRFDVISVLYQKVGEITKKSNILIIIFKF